MPLKIDSLKSESRVWLRRICSFSSLMRTSRSRRRTAYVGPSIVPEVPVAMPVPALPALSGLAEPGEPGVAAVASGAAAATGALEAAGAPADEVAVAARVVGADFA